MMTCYRVDRDEVKFALKQEDDPKDFTGGVVSAYKGRERQVT